MVNQIYYHATDRDSAREILQNGFLGGWGDVGFGVYFYGNPVSVSNYVKKGGWDGHLKNPVVIAVQDSRIEPVAESDTGLHPSWDESLYSDMYWFPMEDMGWEDEDKPWVPEKMQMVKLQENSEIDEIKRLAGIVESEEERLDEDAFDFIAAINPKFARALVSNFKRRHFAVALKEVARLAEEGAANPIKQVSQEFGLDARVLQDYAKRAGIKV